MNSEIIFYLAISSFLLLYVSYFITYGDKISKDMLKDIDDFDINSYLEVHKG